MFYSQIVLAKKGPLGKVWYAAHWGDKKLSRPQIFATDISESIENIVSPQVPLALRLSGHLLLGVVRIYSKKVKYLFTDANEITHKMKVAFTTKHSSIDLMAKSSNANTHGSATTTTTTANAANVVAHFGDFEHSHHTHGLPFAFELLQEEDLPEEDWVPAEPEQQQESSALPEPADLSHYTTEWTAFDPEEDEETNSKATTTGGGSVTDIEVTRAVGGDESMASELTRHNQSSILNHSSLDVSKRTSSGDFRPATPDMQEFPMPEEDEDAPVPFEDTSAVVLEDNLRMSHSSPQPVVGGLDDTDEESTSPQKKKKRKQSTTTSRKRRKIAISHENSTQLSNSYIRQMLDDSSSITRDSTLPFARPDEQRMIFDVLSTDELFCRPHMANNGNMSKELLDLWYQHTATTRGERLVYEMQETEEPRPQVTQEMKDDEDEDFPVPDHEPEETPFPEEEEEDTVPPPSPPVEEDSGFVADAGFTDEEEDIDESSSRISLGLANDLLAEDVANNSTSTASKWHPHTRKVYQLMREELQDKSATTTASFQSLTEGCSRRTAAAIFFEVLQLKTWDILEVDQKSAYGDIVLTTGPKFEEGVL